MSDKIRHLEGKYKTISSLLVFCCEDSELRLYLVLKFHAIEKHDCFPKIKTLLDILGWSKDKLIKTIGKMEASQRLIVNREHRKSNIYDITWYDLENERGFLGSENQTLLGLKTRPNLGLKTRPQQQGIDNNKEIRDIASPTATPSPKRLKADPNEPMTLETFVEGCNKPNSQGIKRRDMVIIGMWAETVRPNFNTRGEWDLFFRENLRPAGLLTGISDDKLSGAFEKMDKAIKDGWLTIYNLYTLKKFLINSYATTRV